MTGLTQGAVATMIQGSTPGYNPIVQIINVKSVGPKGERFRMILSDGDHYCNGMLATQQNNLVHSGQIRENVLVKVMDYMNNTVQNRMVVIVLDLQVVPGHDQMDRIGNPANIDDTNHKAGATTTTTSEQAAPMYNRTNQPSTGTATTTTTSGGATNPYGGASKTVKQETSNNNSSNNNPYGRTPSAPIVRSTPTATASGVPITPIAQLNMYQNRWTIKARVTSKSDIRSWSNARGDGTLFSLELLDASGMDVKATFFKEAVDKFYGMLEADKIYTLSGGRLKVANLQYNTCKSNYEITFDQNAEIHLQDEGNNDDEIAHQLYDFSKISALEAMEANAVVDVLAVVQTVGEAATIVSKKSGQELTKCDLTVMDDSGIAISITLWGEKASQAPGLYADQPIVAFRRVRLSDYNGKSGSLTASGAAVINPPLPQTQELQQWWQSGGKTTQSRSLSTSMGGGGGKMDTLVNRQTIAGITEQQLGTNSDKADWISFKATLTFLKKDKEGGAWYTACANAGEPCKNRFKVTQTTDMNWFCDKCQGTFPNCVRRWIFSATIADDSATTWVSFFNEQAETLFAGATADAVYGESFDPETGGNQDKYDSYFAKANHTEWIFKCRVKQEMMGEETRVKASVYSMHPVNYATESRDLLDAIAAF
mmetsp:Transcript_8824/g.14658  ORF Transcript_8824/g.14658 Transcript_8824/m.14658 type:complete len:654 (-) Transcript_8824:158-2119(-)|eukprot:CAMPEP_0119006904 /NCGR_PEP_ID=MMETSP1176-20130426/2618_1 /TAXON_ID=265551 /ORGANISM="Synedropsis recta cf, Strain CCMP1620" /LENGTH=653 /DNA_ID=CAMNT_0006958933 /DNA_START=96 /DNA_END=2057 /DNA_ORIENTATION=-